LAFLIPISARALTLITFTNGTVAHANQVNANFASLTPISGTKIVAKTTSDLVVDDVVYLESPSFVAPRAMTCTVTFESQMAFDVTGATLRGAKNENGLFNDRDPDNAVYPLAYYLQQPDGPQRVAETRQFLVAAGSTVSFACGILVVGSIPSPGGGLKCAIAYTCI
jgi:hypothetical protein